MIGAGLLAKKAVERGLATRPWVKSSLAPGSRVVTDYLEGSGLLPYLDQLRFNVVGYGCTTCIGNSGPLPDVISQTDRRAFAGDRGRPERQSELRGAGPSPGAGQLPGLARAGRGLRAGRTGGHRPQPEPLGTGRDGRPVFLRDIWPSPAGGPGRDGAPRSSPALFERRYGSVFEGDETWQGAAGAGGEPVRLGPGLDLRAGAAVLHRPAGRAAGRSPTSPARGCSRCWATR